jgi:hypothetical protein
MGRLFRGPFFCAKPCVDFRFSWPYLLLPSVLGSDPRPGEAFGQNLIWSWLVFHLDPALAGVPNILFVDNITGSCNLAALTFRLHCYQGGRTFLQEASMKTQSKATAKPGSAKSPKIKLAGKKSPLVVSPRLASNHNETFLRS